MQLSLSVRGRSPWSIDVCFDLGSERWVSYAMAADAADWLRSDSTVAVPEFVEQPFQVVTRDLWDDTLACGIPVEDRAKSQITKIRFRGSYALRMARII